VNSVDVAGRCEAADVAEVVGAAGGQVALGVEELFVLDALHRRERAPGEVPRRCSGQSTWRRAALRMPATSLAITSRYG
jgi:hypothetical protein